MHLLGSLPPDGPGVIAADCWADGAGRRIYLQTDRLVTNATIGEVSQTARYGTLGPDDLILASGADFSFEGPEQSI